MVNFQLVDKSTLLESGVLIEGWESLIWTERFSDMGDFELHSPDITKHWPLLPEGSLVCINESNEIMHIDSREIDKSGETPTLKITGRTFESILERRAIRNNNTTPSSVTRNDATIVTYHINKSLCTPDVAADNVPNVSCRTASLNQTLTDDTWKNKELTDLYSWVKKTLDGEDLGLKNERPKNPGDVLWMTVYDGADRSTGTNAVVFDASAGHVLSPSYLWSNKDYRNVAYVMAPIGFAVVYGKGVSSSISGFNRRVLPVDANDIDEATAGTVAATLARRGKRELAKHKRQATFDGELAPNTPYKYGTHYFLGDKVSFKGKYGIQNDVLVTEYIRAWSSTEAYKAYPTLAIV